MTKVDTSELRAWAARAIAAVDGDALTKALMAGGLVLEGAIKERIVHYDFIDTGATLNSVAARPVSQNEVHVGPATEYAHFGELGIGMAPRPFVRTAVDQSGQKALQAVAEDLKGTVTGA